MGYNPQEYVGSGLPTGFTGTMKNVAFGYDAKISDGQAVVLTFDIATDDEELGVLGDQILVMDNVRKIDGGDEYADPKWGADDDGRKIRRLDGKKPVFNNASKAGRFIGALNEQDAFVEAVNKRWEGGDEIDPMQAAFYEGLTGTWERVGREFKLDNGETVNSEVLCLVEFTGYATEGAAKPAAAKGKKAPAKAAAAPVAEVEEAEEEVEEEVEAPAPVAKKAPAKKAPAKKAAADDSAAIIDQLKAIYDAAEDGDEFLMTAYADIPTLDAHPDIQARLDNGELWDEFNS